MSNRFGLQPPFSKKLIEKTSNELLSRSITKSHIPNMTVIMKDGRFYTADKAEEAGFDSISNKWGDQTPSRLKLIGDTLDELLTESISLKDIPTISTVIKYGKFYTADNRRLWVFRKAEELGFLYEIEVNQGTQRNFRANKKTKFTTKNDGISIRIRGSGDPGGKTWRTWKPNTFQEVNENTVSKSASHASGIYASERRTNVIQDSFCNKTITEAQHPSTYKSSYRNNYYSRPCYRCDDAHSSNCESPVSDKTIQLSSIIRTKEEATRCSKYSLESTSENTSLHVDESPVNQSRTNVSPSSVFNKNVSVAQHPSRHKLSYSDNPDVLCYNEYSGNCVSPVSDKEIHYSSKKRPTAEEELKQGSKSSLESTLSKTLLHEQGPFGNQSRTNVNKDSFCNKTVTDVQQPSTYKISYSKYNSAKPELWSDKGFASNSESPISDKEIHSSNIKRSTYEEEPALRSKSSLWSSNRKTSLRVQGALINQSRTNVSFDNKTVTEAQHPSTYKSSYSDDITTKLDVRCYDDFLGNCESQVSDKEIHRSSMKRSTAEKDPTPKSKSSLGSTLRKTSLDVQGPLGYRSRTDLNQDSICNEPVTETQIQIRNKSSYSDNISTKPDAQCYNDFLGNCDSQVSDKEIHRSSMKRSTAEKEATLKSKSSLESTLRKTSLDIQGPLGYPSRTDVNQDSFGNKTVTGAQNASTYKSSYSINISTKPHVRCDNDYLGNCESPVSPTEIHRLSIKRSSAEKEPTLKSKSSVVSTLRKTSLRVQGPLGYRKRADINQDYICNEPVTETQIPIRNKSSYSDNISTKPDIQCYNDFLGNCESQVSPKEINRSSMKRSTAEKDPTPKSKSSLGSTLRKTSLDVQGPLGYRSRTDLNQDSICNEPVTETQIPIRNKSSYSDNISTKPDIQCYNDFLGNCESQVSPKEIHRSSMKRSTAEKDPTPKSKSSLGSTLRKTSLDVQGPLGYRSRTDLNQDSICNEPVTETQIQIRNKSSYSDNISTKPDAQSYNDFLGNCDSQVSDKEIHRSSMKRSTAEKEPTLKSKSSLESTLRKTSLDIQGPLGYPSRTDVNQDSFETKTVTGAQNASTYKSSYSINISTKPHVRCDNDYLGNRISSIPYRNPPFNDNISTKPDAQCYNDFVGNCDSQVSDEEIHRSSMKRSTAEKDPTPKSKSSLGSTLRKTSLDVQGPLGYRSRTDLNQDSICNEPVTETQIQIRNKSSYSDNISTKPDAQSYNDFLGNCDSQVSDKEIHRSSMKRSTAEKEPTLKSKSSLESTLRKTSLDIQGPLGYPSRTDVNQDSFGNKTVTGAQNASTYKSSYSINISTKPHVRCDNDYLGNCESPVSPTEIHRSSIKRSSAEKEPTLKTKSSVVSTLRKTSLRIQGPLGYRSRTDINQDSICNEPVTETQIPIRNKSSFSDNISTKPDAQCYNDFVGNCDSQVSDEEIHRSSMKRSTAEKDPTPKSKSSLGSTLRKTVGYRSRTNVNQDSFGNKTVAEAQNTSTHKSSYSDNITTEPDVRCYNDFLGNCESQISDKEIHRSSIKRSRAEKEQPLKSKSSFESALGKTSLHVPSPLVNQSSTYVNQDSFCKETVTGAQHPSKYKLSHRHYDSPKHDVRCDNDFSSNIESSVSDKEIHRSNFKTAEERPTLRSKSYFDSTLQ
ncbi:unnamed protein product [Mytilus coruscus]|uniref:Uncharacterized protein n=1 Tax=Mytilus coruscus TaxID=42192 RepID=A0A6J8CCK3_MYTCO|nr:unnamed protein product [Mytilus coruscus]